MRSSGTILVFVLSLALTSCALHRAQDPVPSTAQALQEVIDAQDRVNRYLHAEVVPGLTSCWTALEGEGTIVLRAGYHREGDLWMAGETAVSGSNLAKGQEDLALRCFQTAVRGTAFPAVTADGDAKEFLVNWSLPVPWPEDITEVALRMSTNPGGGGGCGGPEAPAPACWDCAFIPIISFSYCANSCAGYSQCTPIANGCQLGPITPKCVTASPFGNIGGIVLY